MTRKDLRCYANQAFCPSTRRCSKRASFSGTTTSSCSVGQRTKLNANDWPRCEVPRLLFLADDGPPPPRTDLLEDWVRLPLDPRRADGSDGRRWRGGPRVPSRRPSSTTTDCCGGATIGWRFPRPRSPWSNCCSAGFAGSSATRSSSRRTKRTEAAPTRSRPRRCSVGSSSGSPRWARPSQRSRAGLHARRAQRLSAPRRSRGQSVTMPA